MLTQFRQRKKSDLCVPHLSNASVHRVAVYTLAFAICKRSSGSLTGVIAKPDKLIYRVVFMATRPPLGRDTSTGIVWV